MTDGVNRLTVERAPDVRGDAPVRHVDQLSESARDGLWALRENERRTVDGLRPGEVVKAEDYLRVVRDRRNGAD